MMEGQTPGALHGSAHQFRPVDPATRLLALQPDHVAAQQWLQVLLKKLGQDS